MGAITRPMPTPTSTPLTKLFMLQLPFLSLSVQQGTRKGHPYHGRTVPTTSGCSTFAELFLLPLLMMTRLSETIRFKLPNITIKSVTSRNTLQRLHRDRQMESL